MATACQQEGVFGRISPMAMLSGKRVPWQSEGVHRTLGLSMEVLHEQWWRAVEESRIPTVVAGVSTGEVLGANSAFKGLLGLGSDALKGTSIGDMVPGEAWDEMGALAERALGGGEGFLERGKFLHRTGRVLQCRVQARLVLFLGQEAIELALWPASGESTGITDKAASFFKDLVQIAPYLHDFDQVLDRILERFAKAVPFQAFVMSLVEDGELARITIYTGQDPLEEFLSHAQEEILGSLLHLGVRIQPMRLQHSVRERGWIPRVGEPRVGSRLILPIPVTGARGVHGVGGLFHQDVNAFCSEDTGLFSAFVGGIASSYLVYYSFKRLELQSHTDPMTGLVNRRGLFLQLETMMAMARREARPITLLMVDIDHFKAVNDRWGHQAGDEVLKQLAQVLRSSVREMDLVARFGGEEFLMVLPGIDAKTGVEIGERIRTEVASTTFQVSASSLKGGPLPGIRITISIGVGEMRPFEEVDRVISRVDTALYRAKGQGRNRVSVEQEEGTS
jgi:diguanylate cyclase (GGDEF)-like protein/PAS domain S-box-containing protein